MSKENVKELLNTITTKDAVTAVKIAMQLNEDRNPTIDGLINLAALLDKNSKLLATKVLELEKKIESLESYANREI
jgi:DNA polymerase IIIc chi subunit